MVTNENRKCVLLLKRGLEVSWWFKLLECVSEGNTMVGEGKRKVKVRTLTVSDAKAHFGVGGTVWFEYLPAFKKNVPGYNFFGPEQILEIQNFWQVDGQIVGLVSLTRNWHTCPACYSIAGTKGIGSRNGQGVLGKLPQIFNTYRCQKCHNKWEVKI